MRALAVGLVMLYHFWPKRVPGGFIGVDIFFVISGFLITTHLLKNPPRKLYDLAVFWGRRVRRLLPAAFTVIILTTVGVLLLGPMTQWQANGQSAIMSALYVENWNLAWTSVDYLASTAPPTALQHYWSLSVEEQFYLVWPILIGIAGLIVRKHWHRFRRVAGVATALVVSLSLAYSIYLTRIDPAQAYFVTPTRMWELGAGGVLAAVYPSLERRLSSVPAVKVALVAVGAGLIVWSGLRLTGDAFPGWIALVPVVGALLVIGAGPADYAVSFDRFLKWRPFQFLGDISYSLYLWHWPAVVLVPWALGHPMTWPIKLATIAVVIGLSWASKTFIEDRFRGSHPLGVPLRRTFIFLVTGMLVTAGVGFGAIVVTQVIGKPNQLPTVPATAVCIGAAARLDPACAAGDPHGSGLLMTPLQAAQDQNLAYADNCWWSQGSPDKYPICRYGSTDPAAPQIALFGNSHAGPYLNPLITIANNHNWALSTYLASRCYPSTLPLDFPDPAVQQGCADFTTRSIQDMKAHGVQLVVMSVRSQSVPLANAGTDQNQQLLNMDNDLLNLLTNNGFKVLVIRDVPYPPNSVIDCLSENLSNVGACDGPRSSRLLADPLFSAAQASTNPAVSALDFTDAICDDTTCWDVVGGVIVYFNQGHLTTTFANSLLPYLEPAVVAALP